MITKGEIYQDDLVAFSEDGTIAIFKDRQNNCYVPFRVTTPFSPADGKNLWADDKPIILKIENTVNISEEIEEIMQWIQHWADSLSAILKEPGAAMELSDDEMRFFSMGGGNSETCH